MTNKIQTVIMHVIVKNVWHENVKCLNIPPVLCSKAVYKSQENFPDECHSFLAPEIYNQNNKTLK